jgi:hypothetical protein
MKRDGRFSLQAESIPQLSLKHLLIRAAFPLRATLPGGTIEGERIVSAVFGKSRPLTPQQQS